MINKFKVGDILRCKKGFAGDGTYQDNKLKYGGGGYKPELVFTVTRIDNGTTPIYWEGLNSCGIYEFALELAKTNWKKRIEDD